MHIAWNGKIVSCLFCIFLLAATGFGQESNTNPDTKKPVNQVNAKSGKPSDHSDDKKDGDEKEASQHGEKPALEKQVIKHTDRISSNFITLMQNSWDDVAVSIIGLIFKVIYYLALFGAIGFFAGLISFLAIRAFGWTRFRWKHYWTVSWFLPLLFVFCFTVGFSYAGFFYGAKVYCKKMIEEDLIIERATMTLYCTLIMEHAEYETKGGDSIEDLMTVMDAADEYHIEFDESLKKEIKSNLNKEELSWFENFVVEQTISLVDDRLAKLSKEKGIDIRVAIMAYMDREAAEKKFGKDNVKTVIALATPLFEKGREYATQIISVPLNFQLYVGLILGIGIPLGTLGLFHLIQTVTGATANITHKEVPPTTGSQENVKPIPPADKNNNNR